LLFGWIRTNTYQASAVRKIQSENISIDILELAGLLSANDADDNSDNDSESRVVSHAASLGEGNT